MNRAMRFSLARCISCYAGNLLPILSISKPNPHQISPLGKAMSSLSSLDFHRLLSSEISKPSESNLDQSRNIDDAENLSNEELKKQIEKLYDGDADSFGSVFETVLRRKLSGKTDKLDEDLVNELPNMPRVDEYDGSRSEESDSDSKSDDTDEDKLC